MKIFYAVQATGNGHIARAGQLMPYLQNLGEVDVFLSGKNHSLQPNFAVKYRSEGLSLFYDRDGGLDKLQMLRKNNLIKAFRDARHLPLEKYDLILNDFDFITASAVKMKNLPSIQFGHQASFISPASPRPKIKSLSGELLFNHFAPATSYVGLHFKRYDHFIFPPVIKESILYASPKDLGYILVYLPAVSTVTLTRVFSSFRDFRFVVFCQEAKQIRKNGNVVVQPVSNQAFSAHMVFAGGVITGGGFETPAEALFMKKKLLICPISRHYEQLCNAAALEMEGISVLYHLSPESLKKTLSTWLYQATSSFGVEVNNIPETLEYMLSINESLQKEKKQSSS